MLCRSQARAEKERPILRLKRDRLREELIQIDTWLRRTPQSAHEAVGRRINLQPGGHGNHRRRGAARRAGLHLRSAHQQPG